MTTPLATPLTPEQITRQAGSSFTVSFLFLDRPRRRALTAIYAFCRVIDNAVDEVTDAAAGREALTFWEQELERAYADESETNGPKTNDPETKVGLGLRDAARAYGVRREHLQEILAGVAMDLDPVDYQTVADLEGYCFRVASAVGLACLPILGADPDRDQAYARHLGMALQFTNILRDLRTDAEQGRVYVPRELRSTAGIADADARSWLSGTGPRTAYDQTGPVARVVGLMVDLADEHFKESRAALPDPRPPGLLVAEVMAAIYLDLLDRVRMRGGDMRAPPPRVPRWRKLYLALRTRLRGHR
ncbi:MAG: phytoene/squalene synthase family protein [Planctomycetota bacterium]|jgi:phytoene synthase